MKKKNVGILICCVLVCCGALLMIFKGYYIWSERTFNQLMFENQEAYAQSQKAEVISNVEDVRTSLQTMTAVLETCGSEEEIHKFDSVLKSMGERGYVQTEGVEYFSFSKMNIDKMKAEDKQFIERLRNGQPVISSVYKLEKDERNYFGIAEPIRMNGTYVGFIRGLITSETLLYSSQTGFFRDEIESYLIHANGNDALMDYVEKSEVRNRYEELKAVCDEPDKITELQKAMGKAEHTEVIQTTAGGKAMFIACSSLPYNDWIILNVTDSDKINSYVQNVAASGRNTVVTLICSSIVVIALLLFLYYINNKEQHFEQKRAMLLENFSDTVLCEYEIKKDRLNCTSNIRKMLPIHETVIERFCVYMEEHHLVHEEDMDVVKRMLSVIPKEDEVLEYELRLKNCDDEYSWYEVHTAGLYVKGKVQEHIILKITDVTEKKREVFGLMKKAQSDPLTGLLNRSTFRNRVEAQFQIQPGGYLLLIDLDNFKQINDRYGHQIGDELIKKTAECMKHCFRSEDCLGRYGGDEFLVFMPASVTRNAAKERAGRLISMVSESAEDMDIAEKVTCSIGIAEYEGNGYKELLQKADAAMYSAKKTGKNAWVLG